VKSEGPAPHKLAAALVGRVRMRRNPIVGRKSAEGRGRAMSADHGLHKSSSNSRISRTSYKK
jgi:hypothetical protein